MMEENGLVQRDLSKTGGSVHRDEAAKRREEEAGVAMIERGDKLFSEAFKAEQNIAKEQGALAKRLEQTEQAKNAVDKAVLQHQASAGGDAGRLSAEGKAAVDKSRSLQNQIDAIRGQQRELLRRAQDLERIQMGAQEMKNLGFDLSHGKVTFGQNAPKNGPVSSDIAKPKPFEEGRFNIDPGRKKGPSGESMGGFTMVRGVAATDMRGGKPPAGRVPAGPEIPVEGGAPGMPSASAGTGIYKGAGDMIMDPRRAPASFRPAAGAGLDDFPANETEGIPPDAIKKIQNYIGAAENCEKIKDWKCMEEQAQNGMAEAEKYTTADESPKLFSTLYLSRATALIKQADETPGLTREERMAKYAEAEKCLLEAVRLDPGNAKAWEALSWAQYKQGKYEEAVASASKAIALDPNMDHAYWIRAQAIKELSQINKALMLDDLKKCAAINPARCAQELKEAEEGLRFEPSPMLDGWLGTLLKALLGGAAILALWGIFAGLVRLARKIKARIAYARLSPEERRKQELASAFSAESPNGRSQNIGGGPLPEDARMRHSLAEGLGQTSSGYPPAGRSQGLLAEKYELSQVLSKSGPVELWAAKDRASGQAVRIKKAFFEDPRDAAAKALFLKEARTLAGLRHPNVIGIRECLDLPQGIHLVFDFPAGKDAKQLLMERKRFPLAHVLGVLKPVCAALEAAHQSGLAHRSVRPSSFLILEGGVVRLRDFVFSCELEQAGGNGNGGFAPVLDPAALAQKAYDAPEGRGGPQSDVWGLGVSFYELLSGMAPFPTASPQAKAGRAFAKLSSLVPGLPASIDMLIHRALDPDPRARVGLREFSTLVEGACQALFPAQH